MQLDKNVEWHLQISIGMRMQWEITQIYSTNRASESSEVNVPFPGKWMYIINDIYATENDAIKI